MTEKMIKLWNKQVAPDDTVYSLGDWAFGQIEKSEELIPRLNGRLTMITGNHDKEIKKNRRRLLDAGLVDHIYGEHELYVNNQFICLYHYGCRVWNKSHHGAWQLFGHSHGSLPPYGKSVDVGVDAPFITGKAEYRPFSFYEIKQFMDKQVTEKVDHHGD
jgi:calcineurin-like phosphoesterase family protein